MAFNLTLKERSVVLKGRIVDLKDRTIMLRWLSFLNWLVYVITASSVSNYDPDSHVKLSTGERTAVKLSTSYVSNFRFLWMNYHTFFFQL